MRRASGLLRPLLQTSALSPEGISTQLEAAASRITLSILDAHGRTCGCADCRCTTSFPFTHSQQHRYYAKKKASKSASSSTPRPKEPNPYAPAPLPKPDMSSRQPSSLKNLTHEERQLLQSLVPDGAPLKSLRQVGWPLTRQDVMQLQHHHMSQAMGQITQTTPFVFDNIFLSAQAMADFLAEAMTDGTQFSDMEQMLHLCLPEQEHIVRGMKIQVKGIISGRGGKASKKVFEHGLTSITTFDDQVDYAMATCTTKNGHLGIKVWIIYQTGAVPHNMCRSRPAPELSLEEILAAPRQRVQRSRNAWWSLSGASA